MALPPSQPVDRGRSDEGIGDLVHRLRDDGERLVRAEIDMVKSRVAIVAAGLKVAAVLIAVAALLAIAAIIALLVGLIVTLATVVGPGWATLIVVGVALLIAGLCGWIGGKRLAGTIARATDVARAKAGASAAQADLSATLGALRDQLSPSTLVREAKEQVAERGERIARTSVAAARAHPARVSLAAAAIGLFLSRRAIAARVRAMRDPDATTPPATG